MSKAPTSDNAGDNVKTPGAADKPPRRKLQFKSPQDLATELARLRRQKLKPRGNWTLPMACGHLAEIIEKNLIPPASTVPTPEETARKEKFFAMVLNPQGMPEGLPLPPQFQPSPACTDAEIDRLNAAFEKLLTYPHQHIKVGSCGPVAVAEMIPLHLAHAAHHLSFQETEIPPRAGLRYSDESAAIADVESLLKGYVQVGNWTLQQTCWHLGTILKTVMQSPQGMVPPSTPLQRQNLASVLESGKIPSGIDAPPQVVPPQNAGDQAIQLYLEKTAEQAVYTGPWLPHRFLGPLSPAEFRQVNLIHAAHHFANLVPAGPA